jgi:hypothetical protein
LAGETADIVWQVVIGRVVQEIVQGRFHG